MPKVTRICPICQQEFFPKETKVIYCSKSCASSRTRPHFHDPKYFSDKFLSSFEKQQNGCWVWAKNRDQKGYGNFFAGSAVYRAHRFSYEFFRGPIPEDMVVCHKCDNPPCVNPAHLFIGTQQDNNDDKMRKGRNPVGEKVGGAKLKPEQVLKIRELYATGNYGVIQLAEMFKVDFTNISMITTRKTWRHI